MRTNTIKYYKKLCGYKYYSGLFKKINYETEHISYTSWKKRIMESIELCNTFQLREYSRYLEQKYRDNKTKFEMAQSLLIPFTICLVSCILSFALNVFVDPDTINLDMDRIFPVIYIIILLGFIAYIFWKLMSSKEEAIRKYFYHDIKEIVDEKIKQLEE